MNKISRPHIILIVAFIGLIWSIWRYQKLSSLQTELPEQNEIEDVSGEFVYTSTPPLSSHGIIAGVPSTRNFSLSEFKCKDGTSVPSKYYVNVQELMNNLQILRDYLGVPIFINSGYRTPSHNSKVKGADNSAHLYAKAADIRTDHHTPAQIKNAISHLIRKGQMRNGGIGYYNTFIHYDIGSVRRW